MTKGLVLYTDGRYEVVTFRRIPSDYTKIIRCEIAMTLPKAFHYLNTDIKKKEQIRAYIDGEGLMKNLPVNIWSPLLPMLGIKTVSHVRGTIILITLDKYGKDASISEFIIKIVKEFSTKFNLASDEILPYLRDLNNKIKVC